MYLGVPSLLAAGLLFSTRVSGHTWNEQFSLIDQDGKFTGPYGYPRGYVGRTDPGFNGDSMLWLLPSLESGRTRIDDSDLLCSTTQRQQTQNDGYPRIKAAPGSTVAMKYLENGHVSLAQLIPGKPAKGGTAFVFGTTSPKSDERIAQVLQWNRSGTGGDGRGRLLAAQNYDDGRCHQINGGTISQERQQTDPDPTPDQPGSVNEQWCETDLILPQDLKPGQTLAIYWIWQWPTAPGTAGVPDGKDEYYTTCSDFDIVAQAPSGPITNTLAIQDPQTLAVSDWKSRPALTQVPNLKYEPIGPNRKNFLSSSMPAATTPAPTPEASATTPASYPPVTSSAPMPTSIAPTSAPSYSLSSAYTPLPSSSASMPYASSSMALPSQYPSQDANQVPITMTATVTVTAVLAPSESVAIVAETHVITFQNPNFVSPAAPTMYPREAADRPSRAFASRHVARHRRRRATRHARR